MKSNTPLTVDRREFLTTAATLAGGISLLPQPSWAENEVLPPIIGLNIIGPMEGYTPHIGTVLSMMNWIRATLLRSVRGLTVAELDYQHDPKSNTIGAMLMHLAAMHVFYQDLTFNNLSDFSEVNKTKWNVARDLGDAGRQQIKGNNLDYYLNALDEVRQKTKQEFKQRDDAWLMKVDPKFFSGQPTNNYCKWFHVAEHESNHNGQIKWIVGRLPGAKATKD
jgi:uncharacterized damage-inducible protein DinB